MFVVSRVLLSGVCFVLFFVYFVWCVCACRFSLMCLCVVLVKFCVMVHGVCVVCLCGCCFVYCACMWRLWLSV